MTEQLSLSAYQDQSANISENGVYRYELRRTWGDGPIVMWVMLNPSTADATQDDPTIRRVVRFTQRPRFLGHVAPGGVVVCNLFAFRATDPRELTRCLGTAGIDVAIGPSNNSTIMRCAKEASRIVCAWGNKGRLGERGERVARMLSDAGFELWALGEVSFLGQPRHPLYLKSDTQLLRLFPGDEDVR